MITKYKDAKILLEKELGPVTFAMFLRCMRDSQDLTQAEMAKELDLTVSSICDIEKGRHLVSPALAAKIAKKFGFSVHLAVECAHQDQITKAKLNYRVKLSSA